MISGKNSPHLPGSSAAHAFHENRPPTKAHNLHSRTGLFRNATSLQQRKKNESSADTTKLLPTDEVHRTKRAPSFFRQFTKPLPASRVSIRQLQAPTLPVLIQISLYPITVSISYHQVFLPALIFNPRVLAQGQHIPSCLIVHRDFTLSRIHKMFPTHLIMLGRARLETVNAGHSEICG